MDSNTQDRKSGNPSKGPQDELEEALKWLEELTNRKGTAPEPTASVPSATVDSPFHGLIEDEEGDLPDWLREVPSTQHLEGVAETEPESRLDWLARMAQRESIEELPTLEWRRIGEPMQSALLPPTREGAAGDEESSRLSELDTGPDHTLEPAASEDEAADAEVPGQLEPGTVEPETVEPGTVELESVEPDPASLEFLKTEAVESEPVTTKPETAEPEEDPLAWLKADPVDTEPVEAAVFPSATKAEDLEALDIMPGFGPDDELPSVDDLDAAMAWIEELAASQDAPIEDIPSVVDRALASKLMLGSEASRPVSPLDELGSESELMGDTPLHPFIEEEDLADTVVLVETMAAEQGQPVEIASDAGDIESPAEGTPILLDGPDHEAEIESVIVGETTDLFEPPPDAMSFEEAMAYLDEVAAEQARDLDVDDVAEAGEALAIEEIEPAAEPVVTDEKANIDEFESISFLAAEAEGLAADEISPFSGYDLRTDDMPEPSAEIEAESGVDEDEVFEPPARQDDSEVVAPVSDFTPWADDIELPDGDSADEPALSPLEAALLSLDAIALPAGRTLEEIDVSIRTAQLAPPRDISSALHWLETTLAETQTDAAAPDEAQTETAAPIEALIDTAAPAEQLEDEDLIAQMPEDPDAVLAWLEQMAGEEEAALESSVATMEDDSATYVSDQRAADPQAEELAAADLMSMPDDPDEAMAWLEGLARGSGREDEPSTDEPGAVIEDGVDEAIAPAEAVVDEAEAAFDEAAAIVAEEIEASVPEPVEAAIEEIDAAADEILIVAEAEVEEIVSDPVEMVIEEADAATDELLVVAEDDLVESAPDPIEAIIEEIDATADEMLSSVEGAAEERMDDPIEEVIEEIDAAADEMLAVVEDETLEVEVEAEADEPLILDAQEIEAMEAGALASAEAAVEAMTVEVAGDEAPVEESPDKAQPEPPKPRKRRAKTTKSKVEEAAAEEAPAVKERPGTSWVDLLKPLD